MTWVRIDDQFPDHPKVVAAGPLAGWLAVCGLCYCNRNLTDGFIPRAVAHRLTSFEHIGIETGGDGQTFAVGDDASCEWMAQVLVEHGIWREVAGGYAIHDYGEYQLSKAEILELRSKKAAAGRAGGLATARARAAAKAEQELQQNRSKTPAHTPTHHHSPTKGSSVSDLPPSSNVANDDIDFSDANGQPETADRVRRYVLEEGRTSA
jgi:hypothetical protein